MADSIVRLKVENTQYDAKIKRAAQALLHMEEACHKTDATLAVLEKDERKFIESLGKMETVSKDARGRVNELSKAFNDLSAQYNRLSETEKKGDYGKALSKSLAELKTRCIDAKQELDKINSEISINGSLLDQLSSKFGINIKQLGGWGAALGAGKVALDVMKDAFMSSESNVDEWGRTIESASSIYSSFCINLESMSFDGWFDRMDRLVEKAKAAYNAVDELNTKMTIINPERTKIQSKITEQKEIIRKKGKDSAEGKAAQEEIKRLEPQLKQTYKDEADMNFKAFRAEVDKKLAEAGLNLDAKGKDLLMRSFFDSAAYEQLRRGAKTSVVHTGRYNQDELGHAVGPEITQTVKNTNQKLLDLFTDTWRQENSSYLNAAYSAQNQSYSSGVQNSRYLTGGSGSGGSSSSDSVVAGSIGEIEKKISDLRQKLRDEPAQAVRDQIQEDIKYYGIILKQMRGELGLDFNPKALSQNDMDGMLAKADTPLGVSQSLGLTIDILEGDTAGLDKLREMMQITSESQEPEYQFNPFRANLEKKFGKFNEETKETGKEIQGVASAFGAVSNALNQLEDPGAKVAGYIASAIGQTAAAFGTAQVQAAATGGPWAWIAFAAAGLATMISTISGIKSATAGSYADGGIIPGNYTSGDKLTANVNSGELILNRAQQGNLANQLEDTSRGGWGGNVEFSISGRNLVGILKKENNVTRRM